MTEVTAINPRTGKTLYTIPSPTLDELDRVYSRARLSACEARMTPLAGRLEQARLVRRYIVDHALDIADKIVLETGKCRTDALTAEVLPVVDAIGYYLRHARAILTPSRVEKSIILPFKISWQLHQPLGVALVIAPWNYPFHLAVLPCICAYIAGNSVILKGSEHTPLRGLMEEVFGAGEFLERTAQVVYGGKETGRELIARRPDKICFTGSTRGGREVMKAAAEHLIPVDLELGGKDPMIVFDDVDIPKTAAGAIWGAYTNCGQTCVSVERLYVHAGIHDAFLKELARQVDHLRVYGRDDVPEDDLDLGTMTPDFQAAIIREQIDDALALGARLVRGAPPEPGDRLIPPILVADCSHEMLLMREETFGPVLAVMQFDTEEEAIVLANDSAYGLSASVWSQDTARAMRVARALTAGSVSINNVMITLANPALAFGGVKHSGFGRNRGVFGLWSFCNHKSIVAEAHTGFAEPHWFPHMAVKKDLVLTLINLMAASRFMGKIGGLLLVPFLVRVISKMRTAWGREDE